MLYCGWRGQEIITTSDRFDLVKFCELVQEHRPNRAHLVPPIILGLAKHPLVDSYDMSSLNMIISAAAPLGKETENAARERLNVNIKQAWGMSELSPLGTMNSDYNAKVRNPLPCRMMSINKIFSYLTMLSPRRMIDRLDRATVPIDLR